MADGSVAASPGRCTLTLRINDASFDLDFLLLHNSDHFLLSGPALNLLSFAVQLHPNEAFLVSPTGAHVPLRFDQAQPMSTHNNN